MIQKFMTHQPFAIDCDFKTVKTKDLLHYIYGDLFTGPVNGDIDLLSGAHKTQIYTNINSLMKTDKSHDNYKYRIVLPNVFVDAEAQNCLNDKINTKFNI